MSLSVSAKNLERKDDDDNREREREREKRVFFLTFVVFDLLRHVFVEG